MLDSTRRLDFWKLCEWIWMRIMCCVSLRTHVLNTVIFGTRAELVHLESFTNYHEPKIEYSSLLEAKEVKQRPKRDSRELVIIIQQDVPSVTKRSY